MNAIQIIGNLTKDPEHKTVGKDSISVCRFTVAVNRRIKIENGKDCDFFNVVVWRGSADNCNKYLSKGKKVGVCGEMQMRDYEDKDGNKRPIWELMASSVDFLSPNEKTQPDANVGGKQTTMSTELMPVTDENLPF